MKITPVTPDEYDRSIKQLTCRVCKHVFYLTLADYRLLTGLSSDCLVPTTLCATSCCNQVKHVLLLNPL